MHPTLRPPLASYPSDELGAELEALKAMGGFDGSSVGDDALGSLRGLEGSLAAITAGNAAARAGMNDVPEMGLSPMDDAPMPNLVRYEDARPQADPSTLASRAQSAMERLDARSPHLEMDLQGGIVGQGGTPIDQNKAMLAALKRETEMGRRQGLLAQNRLMKQGWRPMPQGMDPTLAMMGKDAMPLLVARENARAQADQNSRDLNIMGMHHKERMAGLTADPGGQHAAMAEKARVEAEAMRGAMGPMAQLGRLPPEVLAANPQLVQMIGDAARQAAQGAAGSTGPMAFGGMKSLPPVADKNAAIEQLMEEAEASGFAPGSPEFNDAAIRKGISPAMLREWGQGAAHEAIGIQAVFQPGNLQKNRTKRGRGQKIIDSYRQ